VDTHGGFAAADDAALVVAARGGDRGAFAQIYDRYADRLHDYCWSLLRDREEAADATQDAFVLAAERLGQIRDPSRLRPWLYAVARSQSLRRLRARDRILDADGEQGMAAVADPGAGPERAAEQADLQRLVWDAAAGLSERDRSLLDLNLRHGLEGAELGEAMGVEAGHVYVLLTRVRDQVERSLGALLVARMGREGCPELAAVLEDWDGRFSPLIRKRVARHVDDCDACGDRRRAMVSPLALLAGVPLVPAPIALRERVLAGAVLPGGPPSGGGQGGRRSDGPSGAGHGGVPVPVPVGGGGGGRPPEPVGPRTSRAAVLSLVVLLALVVGGVAAIVLPGFAASDEPPGAVAGAGPGGTETTAAAETTVTEAPTTSVETTTSAPTTTTVATTTTTTTTTTTSTVPIRLGASPRAVVLGPDTPRGRVTLTNPGRRPAAWEAVASEVWFAVSPTGGTIDPGGRATIVVVYDPKAAKPPADGSVLITWDGGQASVPVRLRAPATTTTTTTTLEPRR
jgi:RNA polymerase sigma factor (sigma-70 family)